MVISHNVLAMNTYRQLNIATNNKKKSVEKLSSGYRINRSADDAAGLTISEKMRTQIRGLNKGTQNVQDGSSMCQVADGALAEVNKMLNRITELSVKAANATCTPEDRSAIQSEINELLREIDRIGDDTTFNDIHLFKGSSEILRNPGGQPILDNDYSFDDIRIADISLSDNPINTDSGGLLALTARVDNVDSYANGRNFNLIFGDGSTSSSKLNIKTQNGDFEVDLSSLTTTATTYDAASQTVSRDFNIVEPSLGIDVTVTQKIGTSESQNAKAYELYYSVKNNTTTDVNVDFLFHADTAYNNNDYKDNYYVDGTLLDKYTVFADSSSTIGDVATNANVVPTVPSSMSLVDKDNALPFTEYFEWAGSNPNVVCVGQFLQIKDWDFYNNQSLDRLNTTNTSNADLGFSVIWDNRQVSNGSSVDFHVTYGIKALSADTNISGDIEVSNNPVVQHNSQAQFWIQSSSQINDGMFLNFGEMNSEILGINRCDVTTESGAGEAIDKAARANEYVLKLRSSIGAQENRLEHMLANDNNILENTTAAESRIRDTDMAKEIQQNSLYNILSQAGMSMMTQANQSNSAVLRLLQ